MYTHAPLDYDCPFCRFTQTNGDERNFLKQSDKIFQNEYATAFLATRMIPNNPGHVLIIPNDHFENIYDLPATLALKIQVLAKAVVLAMKAAIPVMASLCASTMNHWEVSIFGTIICMSSHDMKMMTMIAARNNPSLNMNAPMM